jgi:hypothetical protein
LQSSEETERELRGLELTCLILGTLLSSTADGIIGEELEEFGLKEKTA